MTSKISQWILYDRAFDFGPSLLALTTPFPEYRVAHACPADVRCQYKHTGPGSLRQALAVAHDGVIQYVYISGVSV